MAEARQAREPKADTKKKIQDDKELAAGRLAAEKTPGKGTPDKEEGVGTVQNQKR
jgi:hypothetical protein